ncbi:MAG TPA: P-II family nitrogen regulator [Candidatus Wunengus californicus]|uniref:P-II family nitrogen regulator n=1 Tax=Candidatus Wunengus californicus TaxID=3367619 RepID=UPI0040260306
MWRGTKFRVDLLSKIKIEITAKDSDVEKIVNTIINEAQTGNIGEGKVFITSM